MPLFSPRKPAPPLCLRRESPGHLTGTSKSSLTLAPSFSANSTIRLLPRSLQPISHRSLLTAHASACLQARSLTGSHSLTIPVSLSWYALRRTLSCLPFRGFSLIPGLSSLAPHTWTPTLLPVPHPSCSPRGNVLQCPSTLCVTHTHTHTHTTLCTLENSHCREPCRSGAQLCVPHGHADSAHVSGSPALHHEAQTAPDPPGTAFHKLWT